MESLNSGLARKTVKNFACSNCWGDLELHPDLTGNGNYFALCQRCGDETKGYVTKYFVNRRRTESHFELLDAKRMLQKIGVIEKPMKSANQMLKELGF